MVKVDRGERLRIAIARANLSKMLSLALDLDVDESSISRWKNGGPMSLENAARICVVLDISADWFVLGRGSIDGHKTFDLEIHERELVLACRSAPPSVRMLLERLVAAIGERSAG